METKFTPGPWTCFYKHKCDEWHVSVPISGSSMRFGIFDDGIRSGNPEADARLIAAAPDMFESLDPDTLDAVADEIDCFEHSARAASLRGIAKRQRAAIAKATGTP